MSLVLQGKVGRGEFSREVDVTVQHGEILAIVGANGSGKSTVLQTIAGIAVLKSGRLSFDNVVWDEPSHKDSLLPRKIGTVVWSFKTCDYFLICHSLQMLRMACVQLDCQSKRHTHELHKS
jgi:ABC-type sulfate/molybdate transport systems ATPase subunit